MAPTLTALPADRSAHRVENPDPADEPLAETLLRASPLTAVLHRPALRRLAAQTTGDAVEAAAALVRRPRGQAVLSAALSRWDPDIAVLNWRTELLERLAGDHPDLVLDTYTHARLRHAADWDARLKWAKRALSAVGPVRPASHCHRPVLGAADPTTPARRQARRRPPAADRVPAGP